MFRTLIGPIAVAFLALACSASVDLAGTEEGEALATDTSTDALKGVTCGGIANLQCPTGYLCVDDPTDNCNAKTGGADCGGICVRKALCPNPGGKKSYVIHNREQCKAARIDCKAPATYFSDFCGCGCKAP